MPVTALNSATFDAASVTGARSSPLTDNLCWLQQIRYSDRRPKRVNLSFAVTFVPIGMLLPF